MDETRKLYVYRNLLKMVNIWKYVIPRVRLDIQCIAETYEIQRSTSTSVNVPPEAVL